jgi:hypothetical membrane protein
MMRALAVAGLLALSVFGARPALARGPSTPEERAKVVDLTRRLERDPFAEDAPATRRWLRDWAIEVPDIRVYTCAPLLGHGLAGDYPYARELNDQAMFSAAAFAIEHQDKARDEIAQYSAGIEGALRVYEVLLKSRTDARSAFLDDLGVKRDQGALVDHVASLANEKCKRANTDRIAALAGGGVALLLGLLVSRWPGGGRARWSARLAKIYRRVVFACAAYYVVVLAALHVLSSEFDPRYRFMSEYVWGEYGWLMTTTFFVLGLAAFTVAAGLRHFHQSSRSARIGFGLLFVGALFVCLAGVFKDFTPHLLAGSVAIPSVVMAVLLLSWSFRRVAEWREIHGVTLVVALGMLAAFLAINMHFAMPGVLQRVFLSLFLLWLSVVAHRLARVASAGVQP